MYTGTRTFLLMVLRIIDTTTLLDVITNHTVKPMVKPFTTLVVTARPGHKLKANTKYGFSSIMPLLNTFQRLIIYCLPSLRRQRAGRNALAAQSSSFFNRFFNACGESAGRNRSAGQRLNFIRLIRFFRYFQAVDFLAFELIFKRRFRAFIAKARRFVCRKNGIIDNGAVGSYGRQHF